MFGFRKGPPEIKINDKVWMNAHAKWQACLDMYALNSKLLFVTWFEDTHGTLSTLFGPEKQNVIFAKELESKITGDRMLIFAEHYPLSKIEQSLFTKLQLDNVPVLSSLDEPLFLLFGGEKMITMMQRLGMEENEVLGHTMITKAIRRAQVKIEERVKTEQKAMSQQEWFQKNFQG